METENGSALKVSLPVWLRSAFQVGFSAVVALILLLALLGILPSPMTEMAESIRRNGALMQQQLEALRAHDQTMTDIRGELLIAVDYQNLLLRAICYRLSDNKEQALQCEPGYRGYPSEDLKYYDKPAPKRRVEKP